MNDESNAPAEDAKAELEPTLGGEVQFDPDSPDDYEDAPLPIPDSAIPQPQTHKLYVSFFSGRKYGSVIMKAPFEDIETEEHLQAAINFLTQQAGGKAVTILFWKPLEA